MYKERGRRPRCVQILVFTIKIGMYIHHTSPPEGKIWHIMTNFVTHNTDIQKKSIVTKRKEKNYFIQNTICGILPLYSGQTVGKDIILAFHMSDIQIVFLEL